MPSAPVQPDECPTMRWTDSDPDRIFVGADRLAVKSDAGQAADIGPVSCSDIKLARVLNYTGALAERQLKRSLRISAPFDRQDLLFKGPFTIIRSLRLLCRKERD